MFFDHGTGLPSLAYRSLLEQIAERSAIPVVTCDVMGFGASDRPGDQCWRPALWQELGDRHLQNSLIAREWLSHKLADHKARRWIFCGHSIGAWMSLWAAAQGDVDDVICLDLVWLPWRQAIYWGLCASLGWRRAHPAGKSSLSRRTGFASHEDVVYWLGKKTLFRGWDQQSLFDYARATFEADEQGERVVLTHSPEWEAALFFSQPISLTLALRRLPRSRRQSLRVLFAVGAQSGVCDPKGYLSFRRLFEQTQLYTVREAGHMFPLTGREVTADLVERYLTSQLEC